MTDYNAHPHSSEDGKILIVHNGIVENSVELSEEITKLGYKLISETDTEVIVHLFDNELKMQTSGKNHLDAYISTHLTTRRFLGHCCNSFGSDGIFVSRSRGTNG